MWFHSKGHMFYICISLSFLPHCCANIGREVRLELMLPNTYRKIYDTHTCLSFSKTCQNVCLYIILEISKSQCNFITLWGSTCSKKRLAGRLFFHNSGSQGSGRVSPSGSSRAAPWSHVFMFF